jgi:hypothetical protein
VIETAAQPVPPALPLLATLHMPSSVQLSSAAGTVVACSLLVYNAGPDISPPAAFDIVLAPSTGSRLGYIATGPAGGPAPTAGVAPGEPAWLGPAVRRIPSLAPGHRIAVPLLLAAVGPGVFPIGGIGLRAVPPVQSRAEGSNAAGAPADDSDESPTTAVWAACGRQLLTVTSA